MAVPEFDRFIRPTLEIHGAGQRRRLSDIESLVVNKLGLQGADLDELVPSGRVTRVRDRSRWAVTYLRQAGLLRNTERGVTEITQRGTEYLQIAPHVIRPADLRVFPEFVAFQTRTRSDNTSTGHPSLPITPLIGTPSDSATTPQDTIESAFSEINADLAQQVLERVKGMTSGFFERLIVQLMLKLGYGGPTADAGKTLGGAGDGGGDGLIKQDKLGLDNIYLQAKRWNESPVGSKEVQAFVGALSGQGATKVVFITTSRFTLDALDYARKNHNFKLSLVDGIELAKLMIEHDLGVALEKRYDVKRIDSDYFVEQQIGA